MAWWIFWDIQISPIKVEYSNRGDSNIQWNTSREEASDPARQDAGLIAMNAQLSWCESLWGLGWGKTLEIMTSPGL